jgi:hypothetical protein
VYWKGCDAVTIYTNYKNREVDPNYERRDGQIRLLPGMALYMIRGKVKETTVVKILLE